MFNISKKLFSQINKSIIVIFLISIESYSQITVPIKFKSFKYAPNYQIDEVIDARNDTTNVGLILNMDKKKVDTVQLSTPLKIYIKEMFKNNLLTNEKGNKYSITLKINYLEFNKRLIEDKVRYWVFYDFAGYIKNSDNTYTKIFDGFQTIEGKPDMGHKEDSDELQFWTLHWLFWDNIHNQLNSFKYKSILKEGKPLQLSEINKTFELPKVFLSDSLKSGNYDSYQELVDNNPSVKLNNLKEPLFVSIDSTDKTKKQVTYPNKWYLGHSDGKNIFINYNQTGNYIPIERLGTVFEVSGLATKIYNIQQKNNVANVGLATVRAFTFPTNLNTGLAAISGVGLLISLFNDSSNSRYIIDTKHQGLIMKLPVIVIREE